MMTAIGAQLRRDPGLLPGLLMIAIFVLWAYRDGGFGVVDWAPGALFILVLAVAVVLSPRLRLEAGRAVWLAIGLLAAFTAWSYLTIIWAEVPAEAWTAANRTLLYLCVFVAFAVPRWRPVPTAVILGGYSVAVWAVALYSFLKVADSGDVFGTFTFGRLATPITYANATCALVLTAAVPAFHFAARREVPVPLRGLFLAITGTLAQLAVLTQSRASLVALPLVLIVYFVVTPIRARSLVTLAPVGIALAVTTPRLLEVYEVVLAGRDPHAILDQARSTLSWTAIALFAAGIVLGVVDTRVEAATARVVGRRAIGAIAVAAAVVVGALGIVAIGNPVDRASAAWDEFRSGEYVTRPDTPHLASGFGTGRYKLWLIALRQARDHPVLGVGGDNYAVAYLRERDDQAQPRYPHSIVLRTIAQTGLVGTLLLAAFFVVTMREVWARIRTGSVLARGMVGVALTMFAYWFVHGAIDWFWEIPALAAPAFAFLALAARTTDAPPEAAPEAPPPGGSRRLVSRVAAIGVVTAAVVSAAALALPWLAARDVDAAVAIWRADPDAAFQRLDRARALDPLTDEPDVIEAVIASALHDDSRQERALLAALERNPVNWYPMVELAALETRRAHPERARAWLRRAARLNPREPSIELVSLRIDQGKTVESAVLQRMYLHQASLLTGERQDW